MPREPRYPGAPVSSGALIPYGIRPAEDLEGDFDDASSYTAGSISPGSSVSNRSSRSDGSKRSNQSQDPFASSFAQHFHRQSYGHGHDPPPPPYSNREHADGVRYSSGPMPGVRYIHRAPPDDSAASSHSSSRSAKPSRSSESRNIRVQEATPLPKVNPADHESSVLAIYLTHLLDRRSRPLHQVQAFIRDSDRFANVRPSLSLMDVDAFGFWRQNVQQNNSRLCESIKRNRASAVMDGFMNGIEDEWNDWTVETKRGRSTQPRGMSVQYEKSWTTGSVTYTESFRMKRH